MNKKPIAGILFILVLLVIALLATSGVSAVLYNETYDPGSWSVGSSPNAVGWIVNLTCGNCSATDNVTLKTVYHKGSVPLYVILFANDGTTILKNATAGSGATDMEYAVGTWATVNNTLYRLALVGTGSTNFNVNSSSAAVYPRNFAISKATARCYSAGVPHNNCATTDATGTTYFLGFTIDTGTSNNLTVSVSNLVNGTSLRGFSWNYTTTNASDTGAKTGYCSSTACVLTNFTGTINVTAFNISGHYNTTNLSYSFTGGIATVRMSTFQAVLNLSAYRLFLNTSIATFNASTGLVSNNTATAPVILPANNGTNNVTINVSGNYSKTVTCTVLNTLSTQSCNATGIYDDLYTIGASFNGAGISNFSISVTNTTLGGLLYSSSTTNGSIVFPVVRGYYYYFFLNSTAHSLANATLAANNTNQTYNFSLLSYNTFELNFYNETSKTRLTNVTFTVQLISDLYSNNYTTTTGNLIVTALTPESYTIRYWYDQDVPREYYVTLTNQSYNNLTLFMVDEGISQLYLPVVYNQYTRPLGGAVVKLLRGYIQADNTYEYEVVEMALTDTNGQAVLRVVPNVINYKLLITHSGNSVTTEPTKFTASTNAYTLSSVQSVLTSLAAIPSAAVSLTYVNSTSTYVFTWDDDQNIVTEGCLIVKKYNNSGITTVNNACDDGSTGSLIYTITDFTNNTRYVATSSLETNTEFSTYNFGPITIDTGSATAAQIFGLTGFIILLLVLITVGFMSNEHGSDSLIVASIFSFLLIGFVGIIAYTWEAFVGIIILAVILVYKLSRR